MDQGAFPSAIRLAEGFRRIQRFPVERRWRFQIHPRSGSSSREDGLQDRVSFITRPEWCGLRRQIFVGLICRRLRRLRRTPDPYPHLAMWATNMTPSPTVAGNAANPKVRQSLTAPVVRL